MAYTSKFKEVFYPNRDREARVAHFRLVLVESASGVTAIIHFRRDDQLGPYLLSVDEELDVVLNRVVERELRGVRVDRIRLVVQRDYAFTEYPLDFNAADLKPRRSKKEPWRPLAVDVRSRDIVGGGIALFVDIKEGRPAEASLIATLAGIN